MDRQPTGLVSVLLLVTALTAIPASAREARTRYSHAPVGALAVAKAALGVNRDFGGMLWPSAWPSNLFSGTTALALTSATTMIGDQKVESQVDYVAVGQAKAFQATAINSGTVGSLTIYVDASSAANQLFLGLYADSSGHPGSLLTQGSRTHLSPGAWNAITLPPVSVTAGNRYWIVLLGTSGGKPSFRDSSAGACRSETSYQSNLTSLPTTWRTGAVWLKSCPLSAFATLAPITTLIGDQAIESQASSSAAGRAQAFQATASASGTLGSLSVYVDASSASTDLFMGLYTDSGGHPRTLLGQGSKTKLYAGFWNVITLPAVNLTSGTAYWIALLGTAGGKPSFRTRSGTCKREASYQTSLTSLPATWTTGTAYSNSCPLSAFGSVTRLLAGDPTSVTFGNVVVGSGRFQTVTLTNIGQSSVKVSQTTVSGPGFSTSGLSLPLNLEPGKSTSFSVVFSPNTSGSVTGKLSLISSATNSPTAIEVSGSGVSPPAGLGWLSKSPTSVNFGDVIVGRTSALPVLLKDTGSASLTISTATVTGSGFSISGLSVPRALGVGQSTSFSVDFAPRVTGSFTGSVSLVSNASNSPTVVPLAGTAVKAYTVALTWSPSTSTGIVGYNVYRRTQSEASYDTPLNTVLVPGTTYSDTNVPGSQTYYYVTTAVNSKGVESSHSNEAKAVLP